uniref:Vacuolar protein sorting-associated protein 62 n=1 Tax=Davidia involucrata TaxID=16924 RepID=A0A5B7BJ12_DAVIN
MFGCECFYWNRVSEFYPLEPQPFSLPCPIPRWPQGEGFGTGRICLGELEVVKITEFERIWSCTPLGGKTKGGVTFYRAVKIPDGYFSLGHYCQRNDQPLRGYVLVAREAEREDEALLERPLNYTLIWSRRSGGSDHDGYIWLPNPPVGYTSMGFVVTDKPDEPDLEQVRCVRADLTETCETFDIILDSTGSSFERPFRVWNTRPCERGMLGKGVSVGTFFCSSSSSSSNIACLKNLDSTLQAMPNLDQIHALIRHYGPTVFFHPDEVYLPSSVPWFFKNGALVYQNGKVKGERIDCRGSNLPGGGKNDGEFWIDLPEDEDERNYVKNGDMESAELYVHVKPASGGTFTDVAMWVFCPFNGPATIKVGWLMNIEMSKIGEHVSDWEHFTLRLSNFTGELWGIYLSEHSGGEWVDACNLEFIEGGGNKPIVYSSKNGHASFAHPGSYVQGSGSGSIGVRNDAAPSKYFVDSSTKYQIIAAEYLGDGVIMEPHWLQYMREWGPTIVYDSRSELEKIISHLPFFVRFSVETFFELFPTEIYGEEGPTGPKEKDNWVGDERC